MGNKFELKHIEDCGSYSKFELEGDKEAIDDLMSAFFTQALITGIEECEKKKDRWVSEQENNQRLYDAASLVCSLLKRWETEEELDYDPSVRSAVDRLNLVIRDIRASRADSSIASECRAYAKADDYFVTRNLLMRAADEIERLRSAKS